MKTCPYCGKEYHDDAVRCLVDNEVLLDGQIPPALLADGTAVESPPPLPPFSEVTPSPLLPAERRICLFELVLVCLVAFGGSLLLSISSVANPAASQWAVAAGRWPALILHEAGALMLLVYVLRRRAKTFYALGFDPAWKDVGWSVLLFLGGNVAFIAAYYAIYFAGALAGANAAVGSIGRQMFAGGFSIVTFLALVLNPFVEELIVRAYVMTEVRRLTGSAVLAIVTSVLIQVAYHLYQGVPLAISYGATFIVFSLYYHKTKRIFPVILAHLYSDLYAGLYYMLKTQA